MICLVSWYFRTAKEPQLHPSNLLGAFDVVVKVFLEPPAGSQNN